jgi:mannose-6-phosphate isomerase-like protein (cupin superfamily)
MSSHEEPYALVLPQDAPWRVSNMMKIPNANLADALDSEKLGARLWRLPPFSANTWHRHVEQDEIYFVLEGIGRLRIGAETLTVPKYGAVLVRPTSLRQVFNDTDQEVLWLIVGAPRHERGAGPSSIYPEDPLQLPVELNGRIWPPR